MRIPCPHCGERSNAEYTYLGDADPQRPEGAARNMQAFQDYAYTRRNPAGLLQELWQHTGGCRAWLVVERNVTTHEIGSVRPARGGPSNASAPHGSRETIR